MEEFCVNPELEIMDPIVTQTLPSLQYIEF